MISVAWLIDDSNIILKILLKCKAEKVKSHPTFKDRAILKREVHGKN
jgi:hypothetical protein